MSGSALICCMQRVSDVSASECLSLASLDAKVAALQVCEVGKREESEQKLQLI